MENTLKTPVIEQLEDIHVPISDEVITGIRQTLTWMTEYLLPRQIGFIESPPSYTPLLTIPTEEQLPELEKARRALLTYLGALPPEDGDLQTVQELHSDALAAVSAEQGEITHYYWQILSWNTGFSALNSQENTGQDSVDAT